MLNLLICIDSARDRSLSSSSSSPSDAVVAMHFLQGVKICDRQWTTSSRTTWKLTESIERFSSAMKFQFLVLAPVASFPGDAIGLLISRRSVVTIHKTQTSPLGGCVVNHIPGIKIIPLQVRVYCTFSYRLSEFKSPHHRQQGNLKERPKRRMRRWKYLPSF